MEERWSAGRLLGVSGSYWQTFALHAAVRLGVFTCLGKEALDGKGLAGKLGADPRAMTVLLNALAAMGLLTLSEDLYANTPEAVRFLVQGGPGYVGHMILHHRHLVPAWAGLDEAVLSGRPIRKGRRTDEERDAFLRGMFTGAMAIAPGLAGELDLAGCRTLLDLGGGPGTYAIHFCKENPDLHGTVFDLPDSEPVARETVSRFNMAGRVDFSPGNYLKDPIPGRYDVVWLSHILHGEGPDACRLILQKAVASLNPSGRILVHDFFLDDTLTSPLFAALFSLNMLVNTPEGRSYSGAQLRDMLQEAGALGIQRLPFEGPLGSTIYEARASE